MTLANLVPIKNRPGFFAVISAEAATRIEQGYMTLYAVKDRITVETISRNRQPLMAYDPAYRVVIVALDQSGRLTLNGA